MKNPISHLPLGNMRCFHAFNGQSLCAPRTAPYPTGSDEYRHNLDITFDLAVEFNHMCRARREEFKHPNTISTGGLFGEGLTEFSCHNDDIEVVTSILNDMRAQKQLVSFVEIPMHQSTTYGMAITGR